MAVSPERVFAAASSSAGVSTRAFRALTAAAIAVGVVWIGSNLDFSWDSLPRFSPGPFGEYSLWIIGGLVAFAVFFLDNQGFAVLWALLIPAHVQIVWYEATFIDFIRPPTVIEVLSAALHSVVPVWATLAAALLFASWVALFRDGVVGFRHLVLSVAAFVVPTLFYSYTYYFDPPLISPVVMRVVYPTLLWLLCGALPVGFSLWQMWVASRAPDSVSAT